MTRTLTFTVLGTAAPQGSMRAPRAGVVIPNSPKLQPWRNAVAWDAQKARLASGWEIIPRGTACQLEVVVYLPRPAYIPKKVVHHTKKPDADKLLRAICDAITGVLWEDDSQGVGMVIDKFYESPGYPPQVLITLRVLE